MGLCLDLLREWCEQLLKLQIHNPEQPALDGGILCPACAKIHGRCFDAIYPFMYLADIDRDERYLRAAKKLFDWAEYTVSREDGSYVNDMSGPWKGTTVFSVIQLVETLEYHGHLLDRPTYDKWKKRAKKAADFLQNFKEFEVCNVNYRITNSLAMRLCGEFFENDTYIQRSAQLAEMAKRCISDSGLLIGEGRPVDGFSPKGCRPVDIGYNMEESLPAMAQYAFHIQDETLKRDVCRAMKAQLLFMLEDGGIDNSFGTRNYKWTYWGSRTSDGCILGYLLASEEEPELAAGAYKNLQMLKACTHNGFLYGGPQMWEAGELPCVHHGFSHAKVLAAVLDRGLEGRLCNGELPRTQLKNLKYWKELDTYLIPGQGWTATVTGYDWEYLNLKGGHASGGALSLLWDRDAGLMLCAGMSSYSLKEPGNMQLSRFEKHECITPRLEYRKEETIYSNLYDYKCQIHSEKTKEGYLLRIAGCLTDVNHNRLEKGNYEIQYLFGDRKIFVHIKTKIACQWILPIISGDEEEVMLKEDTVSIRKAGKLVTVYVKRGTLSLPYGEKERIYNLVPGVKALKTIMKAEKGEIDFCILF